MLIGILTQKSRIFQHQYQRQVKICSYLYLFHDWFPLEFVFIYSISLMYKCLLELIKNSRRSKVQEKNMSCECALNFDQWKTFSKNYKLIRVGLWLDYKFMSSLILQRAILPLLKKISTLIWELFIISSQNFSCQLNSQRTHSLQNISYLSLSL